MNSTVLENGVRYDRNLSDSYYRQLNFSLNNMLKKKTDFKINKKTSIGIPPVRGMNKITFKKLSEAIYPLAKSKKRPAFLVAEFDYFKRFLSGIFMEEDKILIFILRCAYDNLNDILYVDDYLEDIVDEKTWRQLLGRFK